ncbi:energy transducer TonB [Altererythrobacter sp. BO-6]|uniref:energy transducer TonB n=1 Tax=Altererythrobacter sp. BO-6 TaxID=2604537 RepID=UPI0013E12A38|nr:energy transducer TonB [Altererythrobacter sp. BO-6]QIG54371.1 energy transducer TonB [Altererythrobacter sp. BO-6]
MAYADQQTSGNRIVAIILVGLIHVVVGYIFISGLAIEAVKKVAERVTTIDIEEPPPPEPEDEPPPPEQQQQQAPPPPVAPPPPISVAVNPPPIQTRPTIPPPAPPALVVPPPAPPAPPSQARGATTRDERRWAARIQENYPSRALREEIQGTVGVRVSVTPDGRVGTCQVTASSGSSILDEAACAGMQRYARFNPALDDAGNPTSGSYNTRITYRLN